MIGKHRQDRVAIVTSIHPDFDKRVWRHARSLAESGLEVHMVCPWAVSPGPGEAGVIFHPFRPVRQRWARLVLIPMRLFRRLWRLVRHVDVVHFHDIDILPWMTLLSLRMPVVYDIHENYPDEMYARRWIPAPLRPLLYHFVRGVSYACTKVLRNIVLVTPAQSDTYPDDLNCIIIRNYASRRLLSDVADDYDRRSRVVVFTGGQYTENGTLLLLDIAEILQKRGVTVEFIISDIFADEATRARVLQRINDDLPNITLEPPVRSTEIMRILNRGMIGLSPNLRVTKQIKAIPTKIFEYMAAGLPVVTSDLPYQREYIGETGAGILARPEHPEEFADAIERLLDDPALAATMGKRGQAIFQERFSWESQMPELLRYYRSIGPNRREAGMLHGEVESGEKR